MAIFYYIFMFVLGLILLVWGSNLFVDSAILLAKRLNISEVLIGATIVSFGTTLPETLYSTMASIQGFPDMALGNSLGSILCNTGFIAGTLLLLKPILLDRQALLNVRSGSLFLGAGFLVYVLSGFMFEGLTRFSGLILLLLCAFYIYSTIHSTPAQEKKQPQANSPRLHADEILRLPIEAAAIYIGASILVKYGPCLASSLGIPKMIISLTFVALGTSLPELVTSLVSLKKHHSSLSLGNIIGANILNFFLVGGLSAFIRPIPYPDNIMRLELPAILYLLSVLCIPSILTRKAGKVQGLLLVSGYALYLIFMLHF